MSAVRQGPTSAQTFGGRRVLLRRAPARVSAGIHESGRAPAPAGCTAGGSATAGGGIAEGNWPFKSTPFAGYPRCPAAGLGSCIRTASASPTGSPRACDTAAHARPDRFSSARAGSSHECPAPFSPCAFRTSRGHPTQAHATRGAASTVQSRPAQARYRACHGQYVDAKTSSGKDPMGKNECTVGSSARRYSARITTQAELTSLHRFGDG